MAYDLFKEGLHLASTDDRSRGIDTDKQVQKKGLISEVCSHTPRALALYIDSHDISFGQNQSLILVKS